jgi:hypothetical protein
MSTPPEPGSKPDDVVDATVESPAARASEASRGEARAAAPPPATPGTITRRPFARAWMLAIAADAVQWLFMPLFLPGVASPANVALDVVVCALLIRWCGWHWAFLPSMAAELVPGFELVPTWTAAVWLATRGRGSGPPRA